MAYRARIGRHLLLAPSSAIVGALVVHSLAKNRSCEDSCRNCRRVACAKSRVYSNPAGVAVMNPKRVRFENYSTVQINGELFMTPADFLEAVTEDRPRKCAYRISETVSGIQHNLKKWTPKHEKLDQSDSQDFSFIN